MKLFPRDDFSLERGKHPSPTVSPSSFERATKLFLERQELVRRIAIRYAPSKEIVDDIVQQVYIEFAGHAEQWDLESDVAPLLAVITKNFARRMWREYLRTQPESRRRLLEMLRERSEQREMPFGEEEREALRGCIETLPFNGRRLIHDYYFHRIPTTEIAKTMKKSPETLRRALCRYRVKLRSCVEIILRQRRNGLGPE